MSRCAVFLLLGLLAGAEPGPLRDRHGDALPDGALARLGTIRQRVAASQLALSADGRTLITVAAGRAIARWDAATGKMRAYRLLPGKPTREFWLSSDGRLLAVAEEKSLAVFDTETGACKHRFAASAHHVAFRPDGKVLVTSEYEDSPCRVRLWYLASGKHRLLRELPSGYVNVFAFRPDGKKLFAEVSDNSFRCWDLEGGTEVWKTNGGARHLAISLDGRILCSDSSYGPELHLWDSATGRRISGGSSGRKPFLASALAFAPDGRTVFLSDDKDVLLWDTAKGAVRNRLVGAGPCFAVAADGKTLVSIAGSLLQRWNLETCRSLYPETANDGHTDAVRGVAFSPQEQGVATAAADGTLRYWDRARQRPRTLLSGLPESTGVIHSASPDSWHAVYAPPFLAVTADGRGVLSDIGPGKIGCTDIHTGEEVRRFDARGKDETVHLDTACLSTDGRRLWGLTYQRLDLGGGSAELKLKSLVAWDIATGRRLSVQEAHGVPHNNVLAPDGRSVAMGHGGICDAATAKARLKEKTDGVFPPFAFSADSRLIAGIADREHWNAIAVHELLTGRPLVRIEAAVGWYSRFAFSPDGRLLIAAGRDALHVWEVSTGRRLLHLPAANRLHAWVPGLFANCLAVAPDGRSAATGHDDGTVILWDLTPAWKRLAERLVAPLAPAQLDACWIDLLKDDPRPAYLAIDRLAAAPAMTLPLLRKHLRPVTVDPQWLQRRLADLDSSEFAVRDKASRDLEGVAEALQPRLQRELKQTSSLEVRSRLRRLLEVPRMLTPSPEVVRRLRAVVVLEHIATPEARTLLRELAKGEEGDPLTRAARSAVTRMAATQTR